jgi:hypothetical protein
MVSCDLKKKKKKLYLLNLPNNIVCVLINCTSKGFFFFFNVILQGNESYRMKRLSDWEIPLVVMIGEF